MERDGRYGYSSDSDSGDDDSNIVDKGRETKQSAAFNGSRKVPTVSVRQTAPSYTYVRFVDIRTGEIVSFSVSLQKQPTTSVLSDLRDAIARDFNAPQTAVPQKIFLLTTTPAGPVAQINSEDDLLQFARSFPPFKAPAVAVVWSTSAGMPTISVWEDVNTDKDVALSPSLTVALRDRQNTVQWTNSFVTLAETQLVQLVDTWRKILAKCSNEAQQAVQYLEQSDTLQTMWQPVRKQAAKLTTASSPAQFESVVQQALAARKYVIGRFMSRQLGLLK